MNEPEEIESVRGGMITRKMTVAEISFSAHVDYSQNSEFIEAAKAQHVVLVHGEQTGMAQLRAAMTSRYKEREEEVKFHTPRNLETLNLSFRRERVAKAIGTLAEKQLRTHDVLSGLLVSNEFSTTLVDPQDLKEFVGLPTYTLVQRQKIVVGVRWQLIRWHLVGMFGSVEEGFDKNGIPTIHIMHAIDVKQTNEHELTLEWESCASSDMLADSTLALIAGIDRSPASVKITSQQHTDTDLPSNPHADRLDPTGKMKQLVWFLEAHFGEVNVHMSAGPNKETGEVPGPSLLTVTSVTTFECRLQIFIVGCTSYDPGEYSGVIMVLWGLG
ncbi:Pre-mRNA 3'-end-processing endonuclease polyadenylation factor C-term-domain-containing protein [Mycena galericulata]|nr:Pre-mRNA 3'-end-processing endonuclease polyadenylation factor C-term-domain-containing protein [Mycena galericulata]